MLIRIRGVGGGLAAALALALATAALGSPQTTVDAKETSIDFTSNGSVMTVDTAQATTTSPHIDNLTGQTNFSSGTTKGTRQNSTPTSDGTKWTVGTTQKPEEDTTVEAMFDTNTASVTSTHDTSGTFGATSTTGETTNGGTTSVSGADLTPRNTNPTATTFDTSPTTTGGTRDATTPTH